MAGLNRSAIFIFANHNSKFEQGHLVTERQAKGPPQHQSLDNAAAFFAAGLSMLRAERPELLWSDAVAAAERYPSDARILQLLGLTSRALGESRKAFDAFARAAHLAPTDPLIAHSHARAALEAGHPAVALFDRAARLAPNDGSVMLGYAAALLDQGMPDTAIEYLSSHVRRNPLWLEGQRSLAHLAGQQGRDPFAEVRHALTAQPRQASLHRLLLSITLEARDLAAAAAAIEDAARHLGWQAWLVELAAHVASEQGDIGKADALFSQSGAPQRLDQIAQYARHLIRAARPKDAAALMQPRIQDDQDRLLWPYLALAWRMLGDERSTWLEGDETLVGVYDLADRIGDLGGLADSLRRLHWARAAPLDQSVRGGTQTDGNLLLRDEPAIQALRQLILEAVDDYIALLPAPRTGHPFLIERRNPVRIAGSWSVRLCNGGFHADHIHSQGWISSAFYVALPEPDPESSDDHAGWLMLGESRDLVPALTAYREIEPRPGRLVLFPSLMWHGTRPFSCGERLTVAFDIARPDQGS